MGDKISEVLDSMTATELAALEGELDKLAGEMAVQHYYNLGVEAARREFAALQKSGELTPLLHLIKAAVEPPDGKIRAKFKEMAKGKATTEELKEVAQAQAEKGAAEDEEKKEKDEEKKEDEKSEKKLPPWLQKGKGKKEDEEEEEEREEEKEEEEEKKEDEKKSSIDELLEKASAEELAEFEAKLDEQILVQKYAAYYDSCGRKLAQKLTKEAAVVGGLISPVSKMMAGIGGMFSKTTRGGLAMRKTFATLAKHPTAVTASGAGLGGYLLGRQ